MSLENTLSESEFGDLFASFLDVMDTWGLSDSQSHEIIRVGYSTFARWKADHAKVRWDKDQIERISYVFSINRFLISITQSTESVRNWLRAPQGHAVFGGGSALDRIMGGRVSDLYEVDLWLKGKMDLMQ